MTQSLPDPLALWARASCAPSQSVDAESMAASLVALWGNQEELIKTLGAALGQERFAELVIELMLQPLIRQARLMSLAAVPNPQHAKVLGAALNHWLAAQVNLAQTATMDLRPDHFDGSAESLLHHWVRAFAERQDRFLSGEDGQRQFAALSRAWAGLEVPDDSRQQPSNEGCALLRAIDRDSELPTLIVLASPWCPLASMMDIEYGLLQVLAEAFNVQVLDWGSLCRVDSIEQLRHTVQAVVLPFIAKQDCKFLDLSDINLLDKSYKEPVYRLSPSAGERRLQVILRAKTVQQLGLSRDYIPGELLAVLCDMLYPDWALSAWVDDASSGDTALQTRRAWLGGMPALSGDMLAALSVRVTDAKQSEKDSVVGGGLTLLQLLNGQSATELREHLLEKR